ncbi:MmgE/PrpD family protein [Nocardioides sp. Iso805N]|uniref:MmgE/PrpD family protein n=1 Tax=Nocardioides sp. Iso805N TaxID=1283287 RepID=UPI00039A45B6|nr:MmgE/PrpD family protein [Nocardioides sp. Iso805N]
MPAPTTGPHGTRQLAAHLGQLAAAVRWDDAPEVVRARVLALTADVLATAVAALERPDVVALRDAVAVGEGPSTVIGRAGGLPPAMAGFVNAVPIAREQLQDGHRRARGHPASHVVPAVLAVAEAHGASGTATLSAVLAGYETGVRIGLAMAGTPRGVHDIGTWALLGAAAGVAHLLSDGHAETIAAAIDSAATLPIAPDAHSVFAGFTAQNLYLPTAVQAAVLHGQAAAAGLRAAPGTLERHFASQVAGDPAGLTDRMQRLLVPPASSPEGWTVLDGYLKRHPTCALLHGINDAVEDLLEEALGETDRFDRIDRIDTVLVRTYGAAADFDEIAPTNDMAARFSIPWTVAAALTLGTLDETAFTATTLDDARVRELAGRVRIEHDPELDAGYPAGRPAVVTVRFRDGTWVEAGCRTAPRGDGPAALADPTVVSKPGVLLRRAVDPETADAVLAAVAALADRGLAPLARELRGIGVGQHAPATAQFR